MSFRSIAIALFVAVLAAPAVAGTDDAPASENGRYTMTPVPLGFLRLDTRTGAVSLCTVSETLAQCRAAPDERAVLETEIARLHDENAALKASGANVPNTAQSGPSDAEVDRALAIGEKFIRGMAKIMREESAKSDGGVPPPAGEK
jgi:hypothetical protein